MKAYEIAEIIEKTAPTSIAMPWDNVGFLVGDKSKEITKIMLTLDVTQKVVNQAADLGCDMIISHHPMFFKGIKAIDFSTTEGSIIKTLIKNDITVYACHTNMDCAPGGINDHLAKLFGLKNISSLEDTGDEKNPGIGRIGVLEEACPVSQFCSRTKEILNTPFVRVSYGSKESIKTVAVASGSCAEYIPVAVKKNADVIITADMKYHDSLDAADLGITVIDAGHYPTEIIVTDILKNMLSDCDVEIVCAKTEDVYKII